MLSWNLVARPTIDRARSSEMCTSPYSRLFIVGHSRTAVMGVRLIVHLPEPLDFG